MLPFVYLIWHHESFKIKNIRLLQVLQLFVQSQVFSKTRNRPLNEENGCVCLLW